MTALRARSVISLMTLAIALTLCLNFGLEGAPMRAPQARASDALSGLVNEAFRAAYNLDNDEAMALARRAVTSAPDDPRGHRALAAIIWLDILFRRGAVTVDHYLGGVTKAQLSLAKPPPDLAAEFKTTLGKAIELAEARATARPQDLDARYDLGVAYALQASYTASVEGSVTAAFRSAKRAYDAQEEVLARDPTRVGAGLVVGTYRYAVSALSLPSRMFAYLVGFGGGKERGIGMLEAASRDTGAHVDANTALLLIFSREGRHRDALRIVRGMEAEFPRNRLFILEEGATSLRAGLPAEAEVALTRGIAAFERDPRRKIPGERALWLYKRGVARVSLRRVADARADLDLALQSAPEEWVRGRISLEVGKLADLAGRRTDALTAYDVARRTAEATNDPLSVAEAIQLAKKPYGGRD